MSKIMIDIDDVLFGFAAHIHEQCRKAGLHDIDTWTRWHMWEDYGCTQQEWAEVVDDSRAMWTDLAPLPGAVEAVRDLYWQGDEIYLVTARGWDLAATTRAWLEQWGVPGNLYMSSDKVGVQRLTGRFDYALDDKPETVRALLDDGVNAFLMAAPHNASVRAEFARRVGVVTSVRHFVDIINEEENNYDY